MPSLLILYQKASHKSIRLFDVNNQVKLEVFLILGGCPPVNGNSDTAPLVYMQINHAKHTGREAGFYVTDFLADSAIYCFGMAAANIWEGIHYHCSALMFQLTISIQNCNKYET